MDKATLQAMIGDVEAYLGNLRIETDEQPQPWLSVADPWQRADVQAIEPALRRLVVSGAPAAEVRRAWWERARGHSKTADMAALLCWVLAFSRRRRRVAWVASDKDQGCEGLEVVNTLLRHNPWLARMLTAYSDKIENPRTGSVCRFTTSDVPSAFGLVDVDLFVLDELVHWRDERLWSAMYSSAGKRADCLVAVLTNAGWTETWQAERRAAAELDPRWHFSALDGSVASWITTERLADMALHLPSGAYARLYENQWQSGAGGDALLPDEVDRAVTLSGPIQPDRDFRFAIGVDIGLRRDFSAICVLGKHFGGVRRIEPDGTKRRATRLERILADVNPFGDSWNSRNPVRDEAEYRETEATGEVRLGPVKVWTPAGSGGEVDLEAIENEVLNLARKYKAAVHADEWQAAGSLQRWRKAGLSAEAVSYTGGNMQTMASEVLRLFRERKVSLYNHARLVLDLKSLTIVENNRGFRLTSPRSKNAGHGDAASGFCLAALGLSRLKRGGPLLLKRPILCMSTAGGE